MSKRTIRHRITHKKNPQHDPRFDGERWAEYVRRTPKSLIRDTYGFRTWFAVSLLAIVLSGVVGALGYGGYRVDRHACARTAEAIGIEWRHGWAEGCMVRVDGTWVPESTIRVNDDGDILGGDQ